MKFNKNGIITSNNLSVRVFVRVDVSKVKNYKVNDILETNSIIEA